MWIDKSLQKLAAFMPARYARTEAPGSVISSLERFAFQVVRPVPVVPPAPVAPDTQEATKGTTDPGQAAVAAPDNAVNAFAEDVGDDPEDTTATTQP